MAKKTENENSKKEKGSASGSRLCLQAKVLGLALLVFLVTVLIGLVIRSDISSLTERVETLEEQSKSLTNQRETQSEGKIEEPEKETDKDAQSKVETLEENNQAFLSLLFPEDGKLYQVKSDIVFYSDVECSKEIKGVKLIYTKNGKLAGKNRRNGQDIYAYRLANKKICYSYYSWLHFDDVEEVDK